MAQKMHLLVPVDGSKNAELAFDKALAIRARNQASLELLSVVDTTNYGYNSFNLADGNIVTKLVNDAKAYMERLLKERELTEDEITIHVRFGNPKTVIAYDFVQDHHNDLIVMGATGQSALQRVLTGTVTTFVDSHAPCDVLIVRTDLNNRPVDFDALKAAED